MNTAPKKSFWVSWFYPFPSHCVILNTIFCRLALASLTLLVCLPVYWFFFPELWAAWATIGQPLYWAMVVLICLSECSVVWLDRLKLSLCRMQCHKEKMYDLYFRQQVRQLIGQERGVVYFAWYLIDGNPVKKHFLFAYWEFHWGRFLLLREPWQLHLVMHEDKDCATIYSCEAAADFHLMLASYMSNISMADAYVCDRAICIDYDHPIVS